MLCHSIRLNAKWRLKNGIGDIWNVCVASGSKWETRLTTRKCRWWNCANSYGIERNMYKRLHYCLLNFAAFHFFKYTVRLCLDMCAIELSVCFTSVLLPTRDWTGKSDEKHINCMWKPLKKITLFQSSFLRYSIPAKLFLFNFSFDNILFNLLRSI